jgi:hypothetical protein
MGGLIPVLPVVEGITYKTTLNANAKFKKSTRL